MWKPGIIYLIFAPVLINILLTGLTAANSKIDKLMNSGDYESAYQALLDAMDKQPDESSLYLLGVTAPSGSRSSLFLKEYLQKYPDGSHAGEVRRNLLNYYSAVGLQITAARLYPERPSNIITDPLDIYRIALVKQQLGLLDEAVSYFEKGISGRDLDVAAWCRLGLADCAFLKEDYRRAEDGYKELVDRFPDSPSFPFSLIGLSETYRKKGELDRAAVYYQLYTERFESAPGSDEIEASILDKSAESSRAEPPSILDVDYYIQVGVFSNKDNAKKCMKKFRNMGYRSKIEDFHQNGKTFYKALIGPYDSEKTARLEKQNLEKSQGEEYLIILQ